MTHQTTTVDGLSVQFREVWAHNLEHEFAHIRKIIHKFPCIAMDTEFPGIVARPIGQFKSTTDYHFHTLRCNVDLLKIIQLGLSFHDNNGKLPPGVCTWQFNFKFDLGEDMFAQDSIELLQKSGIDFVQHQERGIDPTDFGVLLVTSGLVLSDSVKWLSFHSGYDFAYLLKILTAHPLPVSEEMFFRLVHTYFPCIYDIKYMIKSCKNLKGGLNDVADALNVSRVGPQHTAGSDSLLTGLAFFKLKSVYFDNCIDDVKYRGILYGLNVPYQNTASRQGEE